MSRLDTVLTESRAFNHETQEVLAELDAQSPAAPIPFRRHPRHLFRVHGSLSVVFYHPGKSASTCSVVPRDISASGIGFLHGGFVYPGTQCEVKLPTVDGESTLVAGKVVRCVLIRSNVHDVGVEFNNEINLNDHLDTLPDLNPEPEEKKSGPPHFSAQVLYVEESEDDRELAVFLLKRLGVEVETTTDPNEALARAAQQRFDMVWISLDLEGRLAQRLAELLSDGFCSGPFVACTSDESPKTKINALADGFVAVLNKPYEVDAFVKVLTEHLPKKREAPKPPEPLYSTNWSDESMRPLILNFLSRLDDKVRRMAEAMAAKNVPAIGKLCSELKASAGGYGYAQIGALARELETLIANNPRPDQFRLKFENLARLCGLACMVRSIEKS